MKADHFHVPFYALAPAIQVKGPHLYIRTSFFQKILNLFSHSCNVHFSNSQKRLEVRVKNWWRWKSPVRIRYSNLDYIDIAYPELIEVQDEQSTQIYTLFAIARNPFKKINLAKLVSIIGPSHYLKELAEGYAQEVTRHAGIRFGLENKKLPQSQFNDKYICKSCGHQLHPDSEVVLCKYCGGKEIEILAEGDVS
jgi:hypothetical protein